MERWGLKRGSSRPMSDDEHILKVEEEVRERQEAAINALVGVQGSIELLATEMSKRPTDEDFKKERRFERKVFLVVLLIIGVPLLLNSFSNRQTASQIVECTSPGSKIPTVDKPFDTGHACYDRNREGTNQILVDAAGIIVSVAECDRHTDGRPDAEFEDCVTRVLAERLRS